MSRITKYADCEINNKNIKQVSVGQRILQKVKYLIECLMCVIYIEPNTCQLCNRELQQDDKFMCKTCYNDLKMLDKKVEINNYEHIYLDDCVAVYEFEGIARKIVHDLKYKGKIERAELMAYLISDKINFNVDLITCVPQSKITYRKRGYNQSREIAKHISKRTGIEYIDLLYKLKETKSQVLLDGVDRWYNVLDAFCTECDVKGKKILIVDDVITTGATLNFCAKALKEKGASSVYGMCFAKTC